MALHLHDFMTEIRSQGIQHSNRFQVDFAPPKSLETRTITKPRKGILGDLLNKPFDLLEIGQSRQLTLRCRSANFPGVTLMTKDDILRYGHGPVDKTVHNALFSNIQCMFIVDGKGQIQRFFNKWQMSIVNFDSSKTMTTVTHGATPYEVSYKDDYTTELHIKQLDEKNNTTVTCTAQKAFPIAVGDLQFGADQNDQIIMLPVTFSYRDHTINQSLHLSPQTIFNLL